MTRVFSPTLSRLALSAWLELGCTSPSLRSTTAPVPNEGVPPSGVQARDLTWDAASRTLACSRTGTSIQLGSDESLTLDPSSREGVARVGGPSAAILLARAKDGGFEPTDFFHDLFDGHRVLTGEALTRVSLSDAVLGPRNRGSARYRADLTANDPRFFRIQYAFAERNGGSCRIAILAFESGQDSPMFLAMATLRDSPWLDPPPSAQGRPEPLAAALSVGAYVFSSIRH